MSSNGDRTAGGKTGVAPKIPEAGTQSAAHDDATGTRNFIETHQVTKVAPKAVPGAGEESADLLPDDGVGRPKRGT